MSWNNDGDWEDPPVPKAVKKCMLEDDTIHEYDVILDYPMGDWSPMDTVDTVNTGLHTDHEFIGEGWIYSIDGILYPINKVNDRKLRFYKEKEN